MAAVKIKPTVVQFVAGVLVLVSNPCALAHSDVTASQARDLISSVAGLVVVDVREPTEYCGATGHIPGALNYPWNSAVLQSRYTELPAQGPVLVVCASGGRSHQAANFLDSKGFSTVHDMQKGMSAWQWETAPCKYSGGSGTPEDPYQIATAEDLIALGENPSDYDKHFILTADIDLDPNLPGRKVFNKAVIAPVTIVSPGRGNRSYPSGPALAGVFDGNGHTISHLTINGASCLGLFGQLGGGSEIRNLGVVDVNIMGTGSYIGGLVGISAWGSNGGTVTRCYSIGVVNGGSGLVGYNSYAGAVTNCYSSCAVSLGGLVGANGGTVFGCYSTGAVSGADGGLVGGSPYEPATGSFWDTQTSGQVRSAGGTGKTTAQMQDIQTYLDAGWDFVGESENGTSQIWQMPEGGGYPVLAIFNGYAPPQLQGQGTPDGPYLITNALELGSINYYSPYAHYRLATSIDLSGIHWSTPVILWFRGTFDGSGHTISHLTITGDIHVGLFGRLASAGEVKDLAIVDVNVTGSGSYDYVGGLVGHNESGRVTNCYSAGVVSGNGGYVGGLVGVNSGNVTQCFGTSAVSGSSIYIPGCVAGLVGSNTGGVTRCYSSGAVSGGRDVGGLIGENSGRVTDSYSAGSVISTESSPYGHVGGLVANNYDGDVSQCYSTGAVSGSCYVGGLVGYNSDHANVSNSYSIGAINGTEYVGGLVGWNVGSVTWCYSAGEINGPGRYVGGLVGLNRAGVIHSFWDIETSGQTTWSSGSGKTTAEMQTAKTFLDAGWDFVGETANGTEDMWWINEGKDYPRLSWENAPQ